MPETRYQEDTFLFRAGRKGESIRSRWGDIADPEDKFYSGLVERRLAVWLPSSKMFSPTDGGFVYSPTIGCIFLMLAYGVLGISSCLKKIGLMQACSYLIR
ncbi:hypothetical protein AVEN_37172-1 [Araneus ventricosus]|uniref:Uncharacterized protein n=1 Tax=Araneus ventricosus TaxID=182803 RepID=A0A4Y2K8M3_ARAVE|nr:hypothetical protein AVEN_37172-1 [Araneus ventricosus]